jgi:hypothetical protein
VAKSHLLHWNNHPKSPPSSNLDQLGEQYLAEIWVAHAHKLHGDPSKGESSTRFGSHFSLGL